MDDKKLKLLNAVEEMVIRQRRPYSFVFVVDSPLEINCKLELNKKTISGKSFTKYNHVDNQFIEYYNALKNSFDKKVKTIKLLNIESMNILAKIVFEVAIQMKDGAYIIKSKTALVSEKINFKRKDENKEIVGKREIFEVKELIATQTLLETLNDLIDKNTEFMTKMKDVLPTISLLNGSKFIPEILFSLFLLDVYDPNNRVEGFIIYCYSHKIFRDFANLFKNYPSDFKYTLYDDKHLVYYIPNLTENVSKILYSIIKY